MAGTVIVPWYATGFRADAFEKDVSEVASVALRYGATSYAVYRSQDDRFRIHQFAAFDEHMDWERYWEGPEMVEFRARHSSWYQVPVLYGWWELSTSGSIAPATSNGHGNGNGARTSSGA